VEHTLTMAIDQAPTSVTASFEALYRTSADAVYAYAASLLRDRSAAEEVTAAAFERAFRKHRSFDPRRGTQRAWLFGIARNAALDELRRRKRASTVDPDLLELEAEPVDERAELSLRRTAVRQALAGLAPRERDLVGLKFHAGLTNAEIARVLGTSETNAGTMLHRTIEKLREACE
jgi:RNA polymerase sigma-70 factor, ECF subfamily